MTLMIKQITTSHHISQNSVKAFDTVHKHSSYSSAHMVTDRQNRIK